MLQTIWSRADKDDTIKMFAKFSSWHSYQILVGKLLIKNI